MFGRFAMPENRKEHVDYGIDISSWQGSAIDWNAVKSNNISFASVKVTEATGYINPAATAQVDGSGSASPTSRAASWT
ncbi:GH25 family lysozyme [Saccharothrix xinjiangensis]|uniref:GH25 family lysozyme n=1 Tax=Saccharothrix xinjiangensis TaxID=204798 RepID=A0ABV9YAY5_9PSEU